MLSTRTLRTGMVALIASCLLALAPATDASQGIPFEKLDQDVREAFCPKEEGCSLDELLQREFARLRLGAFDLVYPSALLSDRERVEQLGQVARGMLKLQGHLGGWLVADPEVLAGIAKDIDTMSAWIASWNLSGLARVAKEEDKDLLAALSAPPEVRDAAQRLQATMMDRAVLGVAPQFVDAVTILICPRRLEFGQLLGFLGASDPDWRAKHWVDGADQWTQYWNGPRLVLALEYAPFTGPDPQFRSSFAPKQLDPDGMLQHALNQAARALFFRLFNSSALDRLERSLSADLVIETVGRIAVLDGEGVIRSSGGQTAPYEQFVPGGSSSGGTLPPVSAAPLDHLVTSRWRSGKGQDWFVGVLREEQKVAAKTARKDRKNPKSKDNLAHFLLESDKNKDHWLVSAPFLGPHAIEQAYPPPEFLNDYREFFKSYQTAFYHWLRTTSVEDSPQASAAAFREFLVLLGIPGQTAGLDQLVEQAYQVPISARDGSSDSLEWRFLRWVSEQK